MPPVAQLQAVIDANEVHNWIWYNWNTTYSNTSTTIVVNGQEATWANWNGQYYLGVTTGSTAVYNGQVIVEPPADPEAAEEYQRQLAAEYEHRLERERQFRAQRAQLRAEYEASEERAEALLLSLLDEEQEASWRNQGWFAVRGSESGRLYRIHNHGVANNVDRMTEDESRRETVYCAHPAGLPRADVHVAQMFLLATDEAAFLRIANSHRVTYREDPLAAVADLQDAA